MPRASTKTAAMAKPGAFISCRQANRKSWIMISDEMRAEREMDSFFFWFEPQRLRVNFMNRIQCRTANVFGVREPASGRWLHDKPILRSFTIPDPGRENPDRGTQLRGSRLNGDR